MNYRTIEDLNQLVSKALDWLPQFDMVVVVPRSGLLVAAPIALRRNVPLSYVDLAGQKLLSADASSRSVHRSVSSRPTALVVDDTCNTGQSLDAAMAVVADALPGWDVQSLVAYGAHSANATTSADFVLERVGSPRLFEWNYCHHKHARNCAFDLDGILCRDPSPDENDDGAMYREFLATVSVRVRPTHELGAIVTSRLESYRDLTESWLEQRGISYGRLYMLDCDSAEARRVGNLGSRFKIEVINSLAPYAYFESDLNQGLHIQRETAVPVVVPDYGLVNEGERRLSPIYSSRVALRRRRVVLERRARRISQYLHRS